MQFSVLYKGINAKGQLITETLVVQGMIHVPDRMVKATNDKLPEGYSAELFGGNYEDTYFDLKPRPASVDNAEVLDGQLEDTVFRFEA